MKLVEVYGSSENLLLFGSTNINFSLLVLARGPTSVSVETVVDDMPAMIGLVQFLQSWLCFTFHSGGPNIFNLKVPRYM